jgi:hypothetical protein
MEIATPNKSKSDWDFPLGDPPFLLLVEFFGPSTHPQIYGKTKRLNQVIEYMLTMCDYLHLVEFSYNSGYQDSLKMSPFEDL